MGERRNTKISIPVGAVPESHEKWFIARSLFLTMAIFATSASAERSESENLESHVSTAIRVAKTSKLDAKPDCYCKVVNKIVGMNELSETPTCGRLAVDQENAIIALRRDAHYGSLVSYLGSNWEHIPSDQHQSYRLLCKIVLKQGKVSVSSQKDAYHIIGTPRDLEIYFVEYGMIEQLVDLFLSQERYSDCFEQLLEYGLLERALEVSLNHTACINVPEKIVLKLLDYVWAGHYFVQSTTLVEKGSPEIFKSWKSDAVKSRNSQWELVSGIKSHPPGCRHHDPLLADIEDSTIRYFRGLLEILLVDDIISLTHFDQLPLDILGESVKIIVKCLASDSAHGWTAILLLAGIWQQTSSPNQYSILAWSPLHEHAKYSSRTNNGALVKAWIRSKTAKAFLTLHAVAKDLWKTKWPTHCLTHLSRGSCSQLGSDQSCTRHHGREPINRSDCRLFLKDLLHLNHVFCNLAPLYYTRAMPKDFQEHYLGIRRYWLERLVRALTYISSIDQDASTILHFQTKLFHEKRSVVTSALEELLYFRLGEDWINQANLSWLLEQIKSGQTNTWSFQVQHSRAVFSKTAHSGHEGSINSFISKLHLLQENACGLQYRDFRTNFKAFLLGFDHLRISEYSNMHAVTATLESFTVYLILMTCPMAYVVPRSWVSIYMPSLVGHVERAEWLDFLDVEILRECLIDLVNGFTRLLWRIDQGFVDESFAFSYGGRAYPKEALQQRNVELIAIALINAADYEPQPLGFLQAWRSFQKVLTYPSINLKELQHETIGELGRKLAFSFVKYGDKNKIQLVTRDSSQEQHFRYLHLEPGVEHRSMSDIRLRLPRRNSMHLSPANPSLNPLNHESTPSFGKDTYSTTGNKAICYTTAELQALTKIQQWWKRCFPKLSQHRLFQSSPKGQAFKVYTKLCAKYTSEPAVSNYLLSKGVEAYSRIITLQYSQLKQLRYVLHLIENANLSDDSFYEDMDALLREVRQLGTILEAQGRKMATKVLTEHVERGDLVELRRVVEAVETTLNAAERDLSRLTSGVSKLSIGRRGSWPDT